MEQTEPSLQERGVCFVSPVRELSVLDEPEHVVRDVQEAPQRQPDDDNAKPERKEGYVERMRERSDGQTHCVEPDGEQERDEPEEVQETNGTTR